MSLVKAELQCQQQTRFSTMQFLVSSEIAGILLLDDSKPRSHTPCHHSRQIDSIANVAKLAATAVSRPPLSKEAEQKYLQLIYSLVTIVDSCDPLTLRHGPRTGRFAQKIMQALGYANDECETLYIAGILHDIGKIGIPENILTKSGKLTASEWKHMKSHPLLGSQILAPLVDFKKIALIIEGHHEKYDGSGYPYGLCGNCIPQGARVLAVADAFTTMTDGRVYRPALSIEAAVVELKKCAGSHFDPSVVAAALEVIST